VQEQLLGFTNEEVIQLTVRHHVPKFFIGKESPPPLSPSRKRNASKKNQCGSDSSVNKKSKWIIFLTMWFWTYIVHKQYCLIMWFWIYIIHRQYCLIMNLYNLNLCVCMICLTLWIFRIKIHVWSVYLHSYQQLVETRTTADTKDSATVLRSSRCW
jgi:hypothetical protein